MGIINSIFEPIIRILIELLGIYRIVIFVAIIISWIRPDPYNPIVRFLNSVTQPVFYKVRQWVPFLRAGMIDFSPIVVIVSIQILIRLLTYILLNLR
jgi:YggT family protein